MDLYGDLIPNRPGKSGYSFSLVKSSEGSQSAASPTGKAEASPKNDDKSGQSLGGNSAKKAPFPGPGGGWSRTMIAPRIVRRDNMGPKKAAKNAASSVSTIAKTSSVASPQSAASAAAPKAPQPTAFRTSTAPVLAQGVASFADGSLVDEYDPAKPNDYDEYCQERQKKLQDEKRQQDLQREFEENARQRQKELEQIKRARETGEAVPYVPAPVGRGRGRGIGLTMPAWMTKKDPGKEAPSPAPAPQTSRSGSSEGQFEDAPKGLGYESPKRKPVKGGGLSLGAKMLQKMGYKEDEGIGRRHTPTSSSRDELRDDDVDSSRVILLQNMVDPDEVDDELEGEVREECRKFGAVGRCVITQNRSARPEEAVRIFVQFHDRESALKAHAHLNGRFFGGRKVKASFYSERKFDRDQLS